MKTYNVGDTVQFVSAHGTLTGIITKERHNYKGRWGYGVKSELASHFVFTSSIKKLIESAQSF